MYYVDYEIIRTLAHIQPVDVTAAIRSIYLSIESIIG